MLTARNMILLASGILVVSIIASVISMAQPRDSEGKARDSYGTRSEGYRGLYEVLEELKIPVEREVAPPQAGRLKDHTLFLISPHGQLIRTGPKYVEELLTWVETGGRLVVAPPAHVSWREEMQRRQEVESTPEDVLEILKLDESLSLEEAEAGEEEWWNDDFDPDPFEGIWNRGQQTIAPPRDVDAEFEGSLVKLAPEVQKLAVPDEGVATLDVIVPPDGSIGYRDTMGDRRLLVVLVKRGKGEIIVLSDPRLWSNRLLALADNSVLATRLLSPEGSTVVFDEFYHGISVRGNILYLLTLPGFATVVVALLAGIGAWAWRSAIYLGPPLPDPVRSRRDVREYVDAMAHFFERSFDSRPFLAHEIRDGVLQELSQEFKLPMETSDVEKILTALRRHDPQRASKLAATLAELDDLLATGGPTKAQFLPVMQRLVSCL